MGIIPHPLIADPHISTLTITSPMPTVTRDPRRDPGNDLPTKHQRFWQRAPLLDTVLSLTDGHSSHLASLAPHTSPCHKPTTPFPLIARRRRDLAPPCTHGRAHFAPGPHTRSPCHALARQHRSARRRVQATRTRPRGHPPCGSPAHARPSSLPGWRPTSLGSAIPLAALGAGWLAAKSTEAGDSNPGGPIGPSALLSCRLRR